MKDLSVELENTPGALARMGELLGAAGISLEGGGVFVHHNIGFVHFLVEDAWKAKEVLSANGINVIKISDVLIQKLKQDIPGQLGIISREMQKAGVNILVQYSDHQNQLILVVDDFQKGKIVSEEWERKRFT